MVLVWNSNENEYSQGGFCIMKSEGGGKHSPAMVDGLRRKRLRLIMLIEVSTDILYQ